ncbi:hypothetical protein D3C71_1739790 [compost metagenome]
MAFQSVRPELPSSASTVPPLDDTYTLLPAATGAITYGPLLPTSAFQACLTDSVAEIGFSSVGGCLFSLPNSEQPASALTQAPATTTRATRRDTTGDSERMAAARSNDVIGMRS